MWEVFDARAIDPWQQPAIVQAPPKPDFADNEDLKKAFGIALGKGLDAFKAGLEVFSEQTAKALWASTNWVNDPIVIANRDAYLKAAKKAEKPLDKEELLAEILNAAKFAEEDKDKASLLKLYAEVAGYIGKAAEVTVNNTNNINQKFMSIKFVKPDNKENKTIEQAPNIQSKISNNVPTLKLVSGNC